jgi:uncharacterized repeat protein (TIGR04076 family)
MNEQEQYKKIELEHLANIGKSTCKYHRVCGKVFDLEHLGPKGMCLDLYFSAYPYCLSLLYGAEFSWEKDKNAVNAQCPSPSGSVHYEVRRENLEQEVMSNGIRKKRRIMIKVTKVEEKKDKYENDCICQHKVGDEYEFNQGDFLDYICPAAFYNIFPTLKTLLNGGKAPWGKGKEIDIECPDNISKIKFRLREKE